MIVVDLNLLIYIVNEDAAHHAPARTWWEQCLAEGTDIGLGWAVIVGFVRLSTNPKVFPRPLTPKDAFSIVDGWLEHPAVRSLEPTPAHWEILKELLEPVGTAGNLTADAHLAALAIEHGATLCSADNDFSRFKNLRWSNPLHT